MALLVVAAALFSEAVGGALVESLPPPMQSRWRSWQVRDSTARLMQEGYGTFSSVNDDEVTADM